MKNRDIAWVVLAVLIIPSQMLIAAKPVWGATWRAFDTQAPKGPATIRLVSTDADRVILKVVTPGMMMDEIDFRGEAYQKISLPEAYHTSDVGLPQLPELRCLIGIPGTSSVTVKVRDLGVVEMPDVLVYPAQLPTTDGVASEEYAFTEVFYEGDQPYPALNVIAGAPEVWRDVRLTTLVIHPFSYRPDLRTLTVFTRMLVEINFEGQDGRNPFVYGVRPILPRWADHYRRSLLNYESLDLPTWDGHPGTELLVIAVDALRDSVQALADWHHRAGRKTDVISLSQVGSTTEEIRDYIRERYYTDNISAVLLVGDVDDLPIPYVSTVADTNTPSDHWYACLVGDDVYPEIDLARLSATDPAMLAHQVRKILTYEVSPPMDDWTTRSILCAHHDSSYIACKDRIAEFSYTHTPPAFEKCYSGLGATRQQLIDAIERGTQLVNYRGHGHYTQWGWDPGWRNCHIHALENGDYYSLVFNICCQNAHLDRSPETLAEAWMNAEHGAAGNVAATRVSYTEANHVFDREMYKAIYEYGFHGTMEVVNWGRSQMLGSPNGVDNAWMYLWLGDPLMQIWTDIPKSLDVLHPDVVYLGMSELTLDVFHEGQPVEGACVCIMTDSGDVYEVGPTAPGGSVTLSMAGATSVEELRITVTAHNYVPYLTCILVVPPVGPYLACQGQVIDDDVSDFSRGNGDGELDMGEAIEFRVTLENLGNDPAPATTAMLTTSDEYLQIADGIEEYGDIPPHGTASCLDSYKFRVLSSVPDQHTVHFLLTMSSGDSTWESEFAYSVQAPVLSLDSFSVSDDIGGDGDGRMEPGEEVELVLRLANYGTGEAVGLAAFLASTYGWVEVSNDSAWVALLPGGGTLSLAPSFSVLVSEQAPELAMAPMMVRLSGEWGLDWTGYFTLPIGGLIDDMERGAGDWTHAVVTPGFVDQWHQSAEANHTPGGAWGWKFGDLLEGSYVDYADGALVSAGVGVGEGTMLSFWHQIDAELIDFWPGGAYDGAIVEISVDGGDWELLTPEDGYPYLIDVRSCPGPYSPGTPCFSGSHGWKEEVLDLSSYSGTAEIRFRFGSDGATGGVGWCVDDVRVIGGEFPPTEVLGDALPLTPCPTRTLLRQNNPNPFNQTTVIEYALPREAPVSLVVYDVRGRLVRRLVSEIRGAGSHRVRWDGRDASGRPVVSGIYFYRLADEEETLTHQMVLLR